MLIAFSAASFGQQKDSAITLTKADYLQKSRNHKTVARMLTGQAVAVSKNKRRTDAVSFFIDIDRAPCTGRNNDFQPAGAHSRLASEHQLILAIKNFIQRSI